MTADGDGFDEKPDRNVDSWNALHGLPLGVIERGAGAAEAIQAPRPKVVLLFWRHAPRYVTRADLRKYGVAIGCAACSDIAVHGKTAKPHTAECRTRSGDQMEHDPEGHECLQVHKRRRDVEPEVEVERTPVFRENEGDPHVWNSMMLRRRSNTWPFCVCETWSGCCC